eukprot:s2477_g11.t2
MFITVLSIFEASSEHVRRASQAQDPKSLSLLLAKAAERLPCEALGPLARFLAKAFEARPDARPVLLSAAVPPRRHRMGSDRCVEIRYDQYGDDSPIDKVAQSDSLVRLASAQMTQVETSLCLLTEVSVWPFEGTDSMPRIHMTDGERRLIEALCELTREAGRHVPVVLLQGQCLAAVWQAAVALVAIPQEQPPVKTLTLLSEVWAESTGCTSPQGLREQLRDRLQSVMQADLIGYANSRRIRRLPTCNEGCGTYCTSGFLVYGIENKSAESAVDAIASIEVQSDSVTECCFYFLLKCPKDAESNVFLAFGPARIQLVAAMEEQRYVHPTQYMYSDTPTVLISLWCAGLFCAVLTIAVTVYNVRRHYEHHEMLPSFGARADRIMQLLLVPAVGAVTSAAQMFLPGATPILSLIRVCQFSVAMRDLIEFLFVLNGSQQHIVDNLPKDFEQSCFNVYALLAHE